MSKVAALFDMHAPCSGVKWGYIPYLVYHYVLFLRSDVPGILAMHLRSRKDNAKPEKCYETCRATTR